MVLTKRTKLSLCQLLSLVHQSAALVLFEKHDIFIDRFDLENIRNSLLDADDTTIGRLINELVGTRGYLKKNITTVYVFEERWADFAKCLMLDGYRLEQNNIVRIEPLIESGEPMEDDLTEELQESSLESSETIKSLIKNSAEEFKKPTPDYYNGCLTYSRVALETLVREIAIQKSFNVHVNDTKVWGNSLRHLKETSFFNEKEEGAVASIYTFISEGAHKPLGFTDEEFVRFGRNLAISACYFIVKKLNGEDVS